MSDKLIRIGFIGLNPDSHWASTAHMPALKSLSERYVIAGVANSTLASSQRTAAALNIPHAFPNPAALVNSPEIDVVVVTVKVPHHRELVTAALNAGKHVYCEWPLGNGLEEARELASLAEQMGVVAVVGTQARVSLEIEHLQKLLDEGFVGKVLSTTLIGSGGNWSGETTEDYAYLFDSANGATMQSIPLAHTVAGLCDVLGPFNDLSARFVSRFDTVKVTDTGEVRAKTTPDQVMVHGTLASGAAIVIHYRGGSTRGTNLLWEINGTEGDIQVRADLGHAQFMQLKIEGGRGEDKELLPLMPPVAAYEGWPETALARNVARLYARMADDIRDGTRTAPSFRDAVALHEVIDRMERSAASADPTIRK